MWIPTSEGRNSAVKPDLTLPVTFTGMSSVGPVNTISHVNILHQLSSIRMMISLNLNNISYTRKQCKENYNYCTIQLRGCSNNILPGMRYMGTRGYIDVCVCIYITKS